MSSFCHYHSSNSKAYVKRQTLWPLRLSRQNNDTGPTSIEPVSIRLRLSLYREGSRDLGGDRRLYSCCIDSLVRQRFLQEGDCSLLDHCAADLVCHRISNLYLHSWQPNNRAVFVWAGTSRKVLGRCRCASSVPLV